MSYGVWYGYIRMKMETAYNMYAWTEWYNEIWRTKKVT